MKKDDVLSQRIQDSFLYLCITSTDFLKMAHSAIKPEYFSSSITKELIQLCYGYFQQFGEAPGQHFHDELTALLDTKDEDKRHHILTYMSRVNEMEEPNTAYVISRINAFVQAREFELGVVKSMKLAQMGKLDLARQTMQSSLRVGVEKEEAGHKFFEVDLPSYLLPERSNEPILPLGLDTLDNILRRPMSRTDLVCVFGGFKGKKSFSLVYFGIRALMRGLKVLHVSHELSLEDTEERYYQGLGGLVKDQELATDGVEFEEIDDDGNTMQIKRLHPGCTKNLEDVRAVRKRASRFGGELIIKKYPMGTCTMGELRRYIEYLEMYEGFIPDVVINDYPEKMKLPQTEKRNDVINDIYLESKGLADEKKFLMIIASQVTRDALKRAKLRQGDSAEDIRKIGNVDLALGIAQVGEGGNRMCATVLANRHGPQYVGCLFAQNLDIGQFCYKTWPMKSKD